MGILTALVSQRNYIVFVEVLTILAVLVLLGYCLYILNVFKKD